MQQDDYRMPARPRRVPEKQAGVPRRFGIGTILVTMAAASLLLAILIALRSPPVVVLVVVTFLVIVAAGQAFLFGGRDPRRASLLTGAIIGPVSVIAVTIAESILTRASRDGAALFCAVPISTIIGALCGYLGGGIVAGVFLIMDWWEQKVARRVNRVIGDGDPFRPADSPTEFPAEIIDAELADSTSSNAPRPDELGGS